MTAEEIRIGNYHLYHIKDDMDDRKEWDETSTIDGEDICWLSEHPDDEDYQPIPLTEEWATKIGFGNDIGFPYQRWIGEPYDKGTIIIVLHFQRKQIQLSSQQEEGDRLLYIYLPIPKYVHTLQNLYFALTGNELTTK
jgi:hypothetical protein